MSLRWKLGQRWLHRVYAGLLSSKKIEFGGGYMKVAFINIRSVKLHTPEAIIPDKYGDVGDRADTDDYYRIHKYYRSSLGLRFQGASTRPFECWSIKSGGCTANGQKYWTDALSIDRSWWYQTSTVSIDRCSWFSCEAHFIPCDECIYCRDASTSSTSSTYSSSSTSSDIAYYNVSAQSIEIASFP